jgi:hypothetical protein
LAKTEPAPEPWVLSVELQPWRWPQAWDSDPTLPSYKDSTSYKAYVYRVIEPKLAAYRAKVLAGCGKKIAIDSYGM